MRTVPSQLLEQKRSFMTGFQLTLNTSRACSFQFEIGKSFAVQSNSLMLPSPDAARTWFSWISDHARSYSESCVVNLEVAITPIELELCCYFRLSCTLRGRGRGVCEHPTHHFSGWIPLAVSSRICRRPLPTRPKFEELATASLLSKNGEYLTAQPLYPCVR